ncbi:hypoxia-responsive family protein [Salix suchowensis]|nr:hypoxia-responsive family protein [Salix suchowensis]
MADAKTKVESIREWVVEHKLRTVGCLWLSGITGSVAYNWSKPNMKPSVKIIHARVVIAGQFAAKSAQHHTDQLEVDQRGI